MIPYGQHEITEDDIQAVISVLRSSNLTQGPKVTDFENSLSDYTGSNFSVVFSNASSALIVACKSLGLGPGDWLWTSPISFVASANCALHCGANVDFVDIDPDSYNMSVSKLEKKLEHAQRDGVLPKVVVPVHLGGQSCDMEAIKSLSLKYNFFILEDASHAIGASYKGRKVGCCQYSDVAIFSFHPVKIITTAEGGAALTNNKELADKMRLLANHGITRESNMMTNKPEGSWYYQQIELGYNCRMPDVLAALGESQLARVDEFIKKRHALAERYHNELLGLPLLLPKQSHDVLSSYHLFILRLNLSKINHTKEEIVQLLKSHDITANVHYIPIHTQPYYQSLGFAKGDFTEAEKYYEEAITIPLFHHMTLDQQDHIISTLKAVLS